MKDRDPNLGYDLLDKLTGKLFSTYNMPTFTCVNSKNSAIENNDWLRHHYRRNKMPTSLSHRWLNVNTEFIISRVRRVK